MIINETLPYKKGTQVEEQTIWNHFFYEVIDIDRVMAIDEPSRLTNSFELILVKQGKGLITIEQEGFFLHTQDIFIVHPSQVYSIKSKNMEGMEYYLFKFQVFGDPRENSLNENDAFPLRGKMNIAQFSSILEVAEELYSLKDRIKSLDMFHKRILFEKLIYFIVENKNMPIEKDTFMAIEDTRIYMENNLQDHITLEMLARMAKISPKYYSALFKKEYGMSVSEYLTHLRIHKAKLLLAKHDEKIRNIASQVGYTDEFYLSLKFKQMVGISPSAYRKKRKKKIAAYDISSIGHLLSLKIFPYAAPIHPKWTSYYYQVHRNEIPVHLSAFQINKDWKANIQRLSSNPPELIISKAGISREEKALLSEIAPVFYYSEHEKNWREQLLLIAQYLGEEQEAREWLRNYDRQASYTRNQLKKQVGNDTFLALRFYRGTLYFDYSRTVTEVFFGDLGMNSAQLNDSVSFKQDISLLDLAKLNPDRLLMNICQEEISLESWKSIHNSSLWNDLKAVRFNQVYTISSDPWREYSPSAHERVLKETLILFLENSPSINHEYVHVQ